MDEKKYLEKLKRDEILNVLINKTYFQAKDRKMYNIMRIIREDEALYKYFKTCNKNYLIYLLQRDIDDIDDDELNEIQSYYDNLER